MDKYEIAFPRKVDDWWAKVFTLPFFPREGDRFSIASSLGIELQVGRSWWSLCGDDVHHVSCSITEFSNKLPTDEALIADGWKKSE